MRRRGRITLDCIFCEMIEGGAPASVVYEDDEVFAALDIVQPRSHKVLVMPKRHVPDVFELEAAEAGALFAAVPRIARAVKRASGCEGLNILQSNGSAAGQTVFHLHIHLFPRFRDDEIVFDWPGEMAAREELDRMAREIGRELE